MPLPNLHDPFENLLIVVTGSQCSDGHYLQVTGEGGISVHEDVTKGAVCTRRVTITEIYFKIISGKNFLVYPIMNITIIQ